MPTKVNIVLDDDVKADLDRLVESGKRSRVINSALRSEIQRMRRRAASARSRSASSSDRRTHFSKTEASGTSTLVGTTGLGLVE